MKPFLLLQHRYLDEAADNEYESVLKYGELTPDSLVRIRMERESIPALDLGAFSGIITGGGPSNVSDPEAEKQPEQCRFERELDTMYDQIFELDFPYLGLCYGMGSITRYLGGSVSKEKYGEEAGPVTIFRNPDETDPILKGIPAEFRAFAGHKEACQQLPGGTVLLASSEACPVQMIRAQKNIYATQFHPELDVEGILLRLTVYNNHGYFAADQAEALFAQIRKEHMVYPPKILHNFISIHAK